MSPDFAEWLDRKVPTQATARTKLSELRRVERDYGDLDPLYDADGLSSLLNELRYTSADSKAGAPNPSRLAISGDLRNNLASYSSAIRKYQAFRDENQDGPRPSDSSETPLENETGVQSQGGPQTSSDLFFRYEQDLQTALIRCLDQIEPGLSLADDGKEYAVPSGRIDALATDATGQPVVIELKAVTARREVLGQIAAYMADIEEETGIRPRGILIAPGFDDRLIRATRMIAGLTLMTYSFSFTFSSVEMLNT